MSILIRPITQSDKARWIELFKEYIIFYKSKLSDQQLELTWQRIHSDFNIKGLIAEKDGQVVGLAHYIFCLLYTSPSPRDRTRSRMPSSA